MKPFTYLRSLILRRHEEDKELDEEFRAHIARHADDLEHSGLRRHEAERQARIAFGPYEKAKENVREQRPCFFLETLASDIRFALRMLRKSPGFATVTILTLALGIGANTAIFSVVDAVLLRPLPYLQPDHLVTVSESNRPYDLLTRSAVAPGNFLDWRDRNQVFEQIAAVHLPGYSLTGGDRPERVLGAATSAGLLRLLGLRPALGRDIEATDDRTGAPPVVMLTHALWERRFGADPQVLGKTVHLGMTPYTVIGVLPTGLTFPEPDVQLWVPLEQSLSTQELHWRNSHYLDVYARLKPRVTLAQANQELSRIAGEVKSENPDSNSGAAALVLSMQEDLAGAIRPALITLLVAVGFVLLISCANVANLLLVRATGRGKELAIRMALGAGKSRVIRQMLSESVLLSIAGGCAGLFVASWTRQALLALKPESLPQFNVIQTDWRVLLFTLAISVLTGFLFGLAPALRGTGLNLAPSLHGSSRNMTTGKNIRHLRNIFVSSEIAVSLILLVGAGLTLRSFFELRNIPLGFRTDHTVTARISIPEDKYSSDDQVVSFYDSVLDRIRSTPGVESAAMTSFLPLTGHNFDNSFDIVGRPPNSSSDRDYPLVRFVDPQFFRVLQIPLLSGRSFVPRDRTGSSRAIVLSESMAKRYFPNSDALGAHLIVYLGLDQSPWEVVGVVGDVRTDIAEKPQPTIYFPYAQIPYRYMVLAVRTYGDPQSMIETIRNTVSQLDHDQPVFQTRTLSQLVDQALVPWRFSMTLLGAFALMALLLAAAGIYGVMSYVVGQRTHEMGVRMALGAQPADVLRLVIAQGAKLAFTGVFAGLLVSLAITRLMSNLLFGVSAKDPFTLSAVALLLTFVALAACYIPARRATKVDPTIALRCE
jgi:putative ABC transport system permease protein